MNLRTNTLDIAEPVFADDHAERFWRDGFAGPFPLDIDPRRVRDLAERMADIADGRRHSPVYGRHSHRDWHLVDTELEALLTQEAIVEKVIPILGKDLLMWRSKIFHKAPGASAIGWHQEWGLFDGEEIGNSVPALRPAAPEEGIWDLTVWIALDDVTDENGPLQFAPGSQNTRVPWKKVPMTDSAFYDEPFHGLAKEEIVRRTEASELLLDIETTGWLDGVDVAGISRERLVDHLEGRFRGLQAKYTDFRPASVSTATMPAGHFVIFSERTMHGSPANLSDRRRTAVNCRITKSDTLVYPGRLTGEYVDGSNLDVRGHESILVSGSPLESRNVWRLPAA
ncbi:phytanoyl-CoA dioxygenase family protein [Sphaerisporangium aureirubrum]|uniref:Phytanoyl-CoA dioxygenase family protein n=1 Tax=Sphaerisporangium aureirubrum TaxID=1544736 RepID=A0ABW1NB02_9ACTN